MTRALGIDPGGFILKRPTARITVVSTLSIRGKDVVASLYIYVLASQFPVLGYTTLHTDVDDYRLTIGIAILSLSCRSIPFDTALIC